MTGNEGTHCCCTLSIIKHIFLGLIILSFISVLFIRVIPTNPITLQVGKNRETLLKMNHTERMTLVKQYVSIIENGTPAIEVNISANATTVKANVTAWPITTPVFTGTVAQSDINPNLTFAYHFLYDGMNTEKFVKLKTDCAAIPPGLVGKIRVFEDSYTLNQLNSLDFKVRPGGSYTPSHCKPLQKLAIVIPFRRREQHLSVLLLNLHPLLQKQQIDYTIFVVNQVPGSKFNRAMLMNIGFYEAMKADKYTCIIFHDVDLLPHNDRNLYTCPEDSPRHMSAYIDKFNYNLPYPDLLGGIVAINSRLFIKVNGYSNLFFGWGGEDDDFSARCRRKDLKITRYPKSIGIYKMIQHTKDSGNEANPKRFEMLKHTGERQARDGINSLVYEIKSFKKYMLYTRINVVIDQTAVMNSEPKPLPDFLTNAEAKVTVS